MDQRARLAQITTNLLTLEHPGQLRAAAIELHALCSELTGLDDHTLAPLDTDPIALDSGIAIGPIDAARCILDYARTSKFMRGIHRAVQVGLKSFPERPLEILYAGCGPFAPLAITMMTQFRPDEVRFTLLDIHKRSLDAARELIQRLDLAPWVREFVQADACSYRHPHQPLHMVITETMQRALSKEPQLEVTLNLAPQLCPDGILIPQCITVDACLYKPAAEIRSAPAADGTPTSPPRVRIKLARLLELSLESLPLWLNPEFPSHRLQRAADESPGLRPILTTEIRVFEDIVLGDYNSGLTYPHRDQDLDKLEAGGALHCHYQRGSAPGLRFRPE